MSDLSDAERQKLLTKIINQKKKKDLVGLLRAQREGTLDEFLRPELEAAGLLQKPEQQEVVVHKPFSSAPAPAAAAPAPAPAPASGPSHGHARTSSQDGPPQLGRPGAAGGPKSSMPTLRRSSGPSSAAPQEAAMEVAPQPDVPDQAESEFPVPKPALSVEDAKKSVARGSVLAKAALFSMGKTPAEEVEYKSRETAVQAVGRRPSNAAAAALEEQTLAPAKDSNTTQDPEIKAAAVQEPVSKQPESSTKQPVELPEEPETPKKLAAGAQQHSSPAMETHTPEAERQVGYDTMPTPVTVRTVRDVERTSLLGTPSPVRALNGADAADGVEEGKDKAPMGATKPSNDKAAPHRGKPLQDKFVPVNQQSSNKPSNPEFSAVDAQKTVKTGMVAARANAFLHPQAGAQPEGKHENHSEPALTKQNTSNSAFASRLAAWEKGGKLMEVASPAPADDDDDGYEAGRSILERIREEADDANDSDKTDDTERAIERPQSVRLDRTFSGKRLTASPATTMRKEIYAAESTSPTGSSPARSRTSSMRSRPLSPLLESQSARSLDGNRMSGRFDAALLHQQESMRNSGRHETNSVRRSARLDPNVLARLQEATRTSGRIEGVPAAETSSDLPTSKPERPVPLGSHQATLVRSPSASRLELPRVPSTHSLARVNSSHSLSRANSSHSLMREGLPRTKSASRLSLSLNTTNPEQRPASIRLDGEIITEQPSTPTRVMGTPNQQRRKTDAQPVPRAASPTKLRTSDEEFVASIARRRRSNTNMPRNMHTRSRFDQLKTATDSQPAEPESARTEMLEAVTPASPAGPVPRQFAGVTIARIKMDVANLAKRRQAVGRFPNTSGVVHAYTQAGYVDEELVPPVQEWQLQYAVLSNNSVHLSSYDPYADQDGQKGVYGKFQRVLSVAAASLELLEHTASPTGFIIQLMAEDRSKALYICPDAIKSLLEWGSIIQHALDRIALSNSTVSETEISENAERKTSSSALADPKSWAADYRSKMRSRRNAQRVRV